MSKSDFIREYRAMLEKLLETKVRLAECKNLNREDTQRLQVKLDGLIDKLISYMHKSIDISIYMIDRNLEEGNRREDHEQ